MCRLYFNSKRDYLRTMSDTKNLGFYALLALTVSSMIGSGIFAISSDMASVAALGPVLVSWLITGFGITMLAMTFLYINNRSPHIETGLVGYIKDGFGSYVAFNAAWGYWISAFLGNVAFAILLAEAFAIWFPVFNDSVVKLIFYTAVNFIIFAITAKGVKEAAFINTVLMFVKITPIFAFCAIAVFAFNFSKIDITFWGEDLGLGSIFDQVKNTMLITLWAFIGIEGAVMFTSRAKKRSHVGIATVAGVLLVLVLLMIVSIAPYGIMPYNELTNLENPAMAGILGYIVGDYGRTFIGVTVIVSIIGAFISWILVTSEILYAAAKQEDAPKQLAKDNKAKAPINALIVTVVAQQIFFITIFFGDSSFQAAYSLATSMILVPYLFVSLYGVVLIFRAKSNITAFEILAFVSSSLFCAWLVYAAGLKYLLLSAIMYSLIIVIYIYTRKQINKPIFNNKIELAVAVVTIIVGIYAIFEVYQGNLTL